MAHLSPPALDALADAFKNRLAAVMPAGVSSDEITAGIHSQLQALVNQQGSVNENVLHAAEMVLSDVQDRVMRDLRRGWPPSSAGRSTEDSGADLPLPATAIVNDELHLWFGDSGSPVLVLHPIPLSILARFD